MFDSVKLAKKKLMADFAIDHRGLSIRSVRGQGKIMLQRSNIVTNSEMERLGQNFTQAFGPELPLQVCQIAENKVSAVSIMCISPTSWIIQCEGKDVETIMECFEGTAQDISIAATDMTDQYICLDIEGEYARALLAKGCALDLSDKIFTENQVARTLLAQANIVIWRIGEGGYRILFDVSLGNYLGLWLDGTAKEFLI